MDVKELPPAVIERCDDCGWQCDTERGYECANPRAPFPCDVVPFAAPPAWCPLRRKA